MSTDDIDAVLEEWELWEQSWESQAMRWNTSVPEADDRLPTSPFSDVVLANVGPAPVLWQAGYYQQTPAPGRRRMSEVPITVDFPHHDEASCPACQLVEEMSRLLQERPSQPPIAPLWQQNNIVSAIHEMTERYRSPDLAQGLWQTVPLENITYDYSGFAEPEDPVERVTLRALRSGLRRPEVDGIVVRNWRPTSPLPEGRRLLSGVGVSGPPLPSIADMVR